MRVLGKPDLDNSVLFNDLEVLLKHYGVEILNDTVVTSNRDGSLSHHGINEESQQLISQKSLPKPGHDDEAQQKKVDEWCAKSENKDGIELPDYERAIAIDN